MSDNHWETQPRKENGEFTFRYKSKFMENIISEVNQKFRDDYIRKVSRGGSYGFLRNISAGNKSLEIHHMPANSVSPLSRWKGPCIIMHKEDHRKSSSYGNTAKAKKYRKWQEKLISEGKFFEAQKMDIKNITRKFGDKYQKSIHEKILYEKQLIKQGVING